MDNKRKRLARLRSMSSEFELRSSSVTPSSELNQGFPSAARRAILMGLALESPRQDTEIPLPCLSGMAIQRTPGAGASLRVTGEVSLVKTPGGRVRRHQLPSPPLPLVSSAVAEKVEALDILSDDEDDAAVQQTVAKWMAGQAISSSTALPFSTAAKENSLDAPETASFISQETTSQPKSVAKASLADADVRPSCSGMARTFKRVAKSKVGSDLDSDFEDEFVVAPIETNAEIGVGKNIPDDEDLDETARNLIISVETAMDEAADRLLGVSSSFTWEEGFESFQGVPEEFSGPTPGPLKDYDTPYDAFTDIWSKDIIELIALETNKYARQTIDFMKANKMMKPSSRLHQWTETDEDEIMVLFAVLMFMGIDLRTSQNEYWKSVGVLTMSKFKDLMTYKRYVLLIKFLHFVDNSDVSQDHPQYEEAGLSARLAKLVPVITHLNKKFSSLYNLQREISIDESLTLFKGRLSWIQVIRTKAARVGLKSYELCESQTGYLAKFQIYSGKNSNGGSVAPPSVDLGDKTTKVVLELLQNLENLGHCVTMDNFYNSPALARYLKSLGFDCLGTLRPNRKNTPNEIAKAPKNAVKGTIIARHSGDVSVLAWKDTKWVTMISTYHDNGTYVGSRAGRPLVKPVSVRDYNNTMGGVDLKDQKLSMYLLERKRCVKWYMKMFKRLLNVSIHNAFVMYGCSLKRRNMLPVTHREFRYMLANSLWERHRRGPPEISEPVSQDTRLMRNVVHVPKFMRGKNNGKRCVVHQRQDTRKIVRTKCVTCDVFLCFENCWEQWHSLKILKGREIRGRKRKNT